MSSSFSNRELDEQALASGRVARWLRDQSPCQHGYAVSDRDRVNTTKLEQEPSNWAPLHRKAAPILTQAALALFSKQACRLGANVRLRLITHREAVEMLEVKATYKQLVRARTLELVQQMMADGLNPGRPDEHR